MRLDGQRAPWRRPTATNCSRCCRRRAPGAGFDIVRFAPWQSFQALGWDKPRSWAARTTPRNQTQAFADDWAKKKNDGVAVEHMVQLANKV